MGEATVRREREPADETMCWRLKEVRALAGITAIELDNLAGTSRGHVSMIEAGNKSNLETRTVVSIAKVLGLSLDWLLLGVGAAPSRSKVLTAVARARLHTTK
jgi:transcriptional regulator with XRE-family HTH domain